MSINLEAQTRARRSRGLVKSEFVDSLMVSGATYAVIDLDARVVRASEALQTMIPGIAGNSIVDVFQVDSALLLGHDAPYRTVPGMYANARGESVPAMLQAMVELPDTGHRLILVTDGAPFRRAESQRFDSTPYAIMRVSPDGIVHFANAEAYNLLSLMPGDVTGRPLETLFEGCDGANIARQLEECLRTLEPVPVNVSLCNRTDNREQVRLLLTADLTADHRPLGALVVIQSTLLERVRDEIAKLAHDQTIPSWEQRLESIIESIRKVFDFDHANFGIYADDVSVFRALAIFPRDRMKWTERWLRLPENILPWLESGKTAVPDINRFLKDYPALATSEVAQMYVSKHMRSSVTLVARGAKNLPTSALSFSSKHAGRFGQAHVDLLRDLDLEPVLIRIENEIRSDREALAARLRSDLAKAPSLPDMARDIVDQIAISFRWDFVALFRVDRHMKQFELFYHNPCKKAFELDTAYLQPIEQGMLAATLREKSTLIVNDIDEPGVEQFNYIGLGRPARSAMTIPVHLNGRIRWILNIESKVAHAFHGPDREAIERLTESIEEGLKQRTLVEINKLVLRETEQGVVTVGMDGMILGTNAVAESLLGRPGNSAGGSQREFFSMYASPDDPRAVDVLKGLGRTEKRRIELVGDDGEIRPVLATRKALDESFDAALWFLIDLRSDRWTVDLRFLRETVTDVAQQTRAPLALASSLARQLIGLATTGRDATESGAPASALPKKEDLSTRLIAEINKADITFERLAENLNIRRNPAGNMQRLDLRFCIDSVIDGLPNRDRDRIDKVRPETPVFVNGDPDRLMYVVRSIMAHLMRVAADENARVCVALSLQGSSATLVLAIADCPGAGVETDGDDAFLANARPDALWRAYKAARGDASLGLSAVRRVIKAYDGSLKARAGDAEPGDPSPPWVAFRVILPIAERSVQP
ncbi:sensory histidine kinase AtoS [Caballeronia udeis]|uniref:Sensory histidine kinase AtoS n=1 Tax=Caballeronia udeis TaxID=1232866 RepID=A0A158JIB6_9BURK|nr:PAS domain-containing protein [Caballeronia udeis]SAL68171.1 sensory histidine kinase AtoS [Caballeronia udeis]